MVNKQTSLPNAGKTRMQLHLLPFFIASMIGCLLALVSFVFFDWNKSLVTVSISPTLQTLTPFLNGPGFFQAMASSGSAVTSVWLWMIPVVAVSALALASVGWLWNARLLSLVAIPAGTGLVLLTSAVLLGEEPLYGNTGYWLALLGLFIVVVAGVWQRFSPDAKEASAGRPVALVWCMFGGASFIIPGFFLPWLTVKMPLYHTIVPSYPITGMNIATGSFPFLLSGYPQATPEIFWLLWLVPVAGFCAALGSWANLNGRRISRWFWLLVSLVPLLLFPLLLRPITMGGYSNIGTYGWHLTLVGLSLILFSGLLWKNGTQKHIVSEEQRRSIRIRRGILRGIAGLVVLAYGGYIFWRTSKMYGAMFTIPVADPAFKDGFPGPVVWAPDGRHLLTTNSDTFQVWDAFAMKKVRSVKHQNYILVNSQYVGSVPTALLSLAWSPDQRFVVVVANGSAQVFEVASGKLLSHWATNLVWTDASWSIDSQHVATIALSKTAGIATVVEIHDIATGQLLQSFSPPSPRPSPGDRTYSATSWSPDNQLLAVIGREDDVVSGLPGVGAVFLTIWDSPSGKPFFTASYDPEGNIQDDPGNIAVAWSPDGSQLAGMSNAMGVKLWRLSDSEDPQPLMTYIGAGGPYSRLAWSPDGKYIAIGEGKGSDIEPSVVRIFDTATGQTHFSYRGHTGFISGLSWSPRGNYIASASYDGVHVWQPEL